MRTHVGAIVLLAGTGCLFADSPPDPEADRVARLIQQLGHDRFAMREAASKELDRIGEPALGNLRKAAASSDDAEIRLRAQRIVQAITGRLREAAGRKDLEKLQGTWYTVSFRSGETKTPENRNDTITCKGNRYIHMLDGKLISAGEITISDATANPKQLEFNASEGPCAGCCFRSIYRVEGSDLILCYNGGNPADLNRPGAFSEKAGIVRAMKRVDKTAK